ncbi:RNA polymerase sigma-54 factor [Amaricoccus macauensis]|uniref:RNA polymerase sigma-54 factor n=1 Tax=Amaricoccus macauensis TaxID=57001 RepID=A0A840SKN3_9RHOB|nr:RNA polymerase factor sigma-54 [Amaricoccus macauensis]MBB5221534.1 RNA polymerase sigma-54 factor [Amaricoccus macauensis]
MALAPRIEIRQTQSLVMTPLLQQAIKLLQMSSLELAGYLAAEVEKNPLLELGPAAPAPGSAPGVGGGVGRRDDDGDWLEGIAAGVTLHQHLQAQIRPMRGTPRVIEAALLIADELEDDGYLRVPLAEVATRHGLRSADALAGLTLVQACDPAGVGARDLKECLSLQLREQNRLDPAMQAMLDNLALAARGRLAELERICGVDAEDITDMLAEIRALDPKPGLRFSQARVELAIPDVYVRRSPDGTLTVELNSESLPRVLMNNVYAAQLRKDDSEARAFVSECSTRASWLIRSLEQRARTILKVANEVARRQDRFFETGTPGLRPLTRRSIAEKLGLHESTVSRVTAGKYLACDHGCYEFSHLFVSAIQAVSGGEAYSSAAVQDRIRGLVHSEPARRTLSDDKLVALLKAEGIDIARRTVAKYRESMGIPSSVERRRLRASPVAAREIDAGSSRARD